MGTYNMSGQYTAAFNMTIMQLVLDAYMWADFSWYRIINCIQSIVYFLEKPQSKFYIKTYGSKRTL